MFDNQKLLKQTQAELLRQIQTAKQEVVSLEVEIQKELKSIERKRERQKIKKKDLEFYNNQINLLKNIKGYNLVKNG